MKTYEYMLDGIPYKSTPMDDGSIRVTCNCMGSDVALTFGRSEIFVSERSLNDSTYDIESSIRSIMGGGFEITRVGNYTGVDGDPCIADDVFQHRNMQAFEASNGRLLQLVRDALQAVNGVKDQMQMNSGQQELLRSLNSTYEKRVATKA